MPTLHHLVLLLLSTIFTSPALSSAINFPLPRQALSYPSGSEPTNTTASSAPTEPLSTSIIPTQPNIPSRGPGATTDTIIPSPLHTQSFQSLRPCTTTLTTSTASHNNNNNNNNNNNRPCPPPTWDGTLTLWPSTTTLFKPINCHGCMYLSVSKEWAVGCPNQHVSATVLETRASTTWREVCESSAMPS